jgi:putative ABC transport system permease protein
MLRASLTIAVRIFYKEPRLLLLTILALSLSFVVSFILWQHAACELNSDAFRKQSNRIVRAGLVMRWSDDHTMWEETRLGINTPGLIEQIAERYTEVEDYTRILYQSNFNSELIRDHGKQITLVVDKQPFAQSKIVYADSNVFSFFDIPLLEGNERTVLSKQNAVVLSKSTALAYFGNDAVIGKSLLLNDTIRLDVTGVFEDLPQNTHLDFEIMLNSKRIQATYDNKLEVSVGGPHGYFKLKEGVDVIRFSERINSECRELLDSAMYNNSFRTLDVFLQHLHEVPFSFSRLDSHQPESRYFLQVLRHASWIIILVGLINYINLMISLTGFRLKELAVKKTIGADFSHFLRQFMLESGLVHFIYSVCYRNFVCYKSACTPSLKFLYTVTGRNFCRCMDYNDDYINCFHSYIKSVSNVHFL